MRDIARDQGNEKVTKKLYGMLLWSLQAQPKEKTMSWFKKSAKRWFGAWFQIFDCLVCILTLEFYYTEAVEYDFSFYKEHSMKFKQRIRWWFFDWISVFEELLVILTLGQLRTSLGTRFLDWSR